MAGLPLGCGPAWSARGLGSWRVTGWLLGGGGGGSLGAGGIDLPKIQLSPSISPCVGLVRSALYLGCSDYQK